MKNKVIVRVKEIDLMKFEISFEEVGDVWQWIKSNQTLVGSQILEMVRYGEKKEFIYETYVDKYLRRLNKVKKIEIIDEREKATA